MNPNRNPNRNPNPNPKMRLALFALTQFHSNCSKVFCVHFVYY